MAKRTAAGAGLLLAVSGALICAGVGLTELSYVSDHPGRYGPAKVIAWLSGAGVLIAAAVGMLCLATLKVEER